METVARYLPVIPDDLPTTRIHLVNVDESKRRLEVSVQSRSTYQVIQSRQGRVGQIVLIRNVLYRLESMQKRDGGGGFN